MPKMLDFVAEIKHVGNKNVLVPLPEMRPLIDRFAAQHKPGMRIFMRLLEVAGRRKDEHHALYRLRNYILAPYLEMSADALHEHIFLELQFGVWVTLRPEREKINPKTGEVTIEPEIRGFDRRSQKTLTKEEMNLAFLKQDELAQFHNEGREPSEWVDLPSGRQWAPPPPGM